MLLLLFVYLTTYSMHYAHIYIVGKKYKLVLNFIFLALLIPVVVVEASCLRMLQKTLQEFLLSGVRIQKTKQSIGVSIYGYWSL